VNIGVGVAVGAPLIVAALVNRNGAVAVITARERARNLRPDGRIDGMLYERDAELLERIVAMPTKLIDS
jgi:hypothetical protein